MLVQRSSRSAACFTNARRRTRAFNGPSVLAIMHAIAAVDPPPPSKLRPELPREFDMIIERALAKDKTHAIHRHVRWLTRCVACVHQSPEPGQAFRLFTTQT